MATRSNNRNRCFVKLGNDQEFKLSKAEWDELLAGGWIEPDASRHARLRRGVVGWVRGGNLHLLVLARMQTVTASWLHAWLYKLGVVPASYAALSVCDRQEAVLFQVERERENEALLWRTFRNTKGANSFTWIDPAVKAEILAALKPH